MWQYGVKALEAEGTKGKAMKQEDAWLVCRTTEIGVAEVK